MSKRERPPITVKAYVKVNGVETDVDTLSPEQRRRLATMINVTLLNVRFAGQAHFYVSDTPDSFSQTADLFLGEYKGGPVEQIAIDKY